MENQEPRTRNHELRTTNQEPETTNHNLEFVVQKSYFIIAKGLLVVAGPEGDAEFRASAGDKVEIVRPDGSKTRARISEACANSRGPEDLVLEGLSKKDVPLGSRLRVIAKSRRPAGNSKLQFPNSKQ